MKLAIGAILFTVVIALHIGLLAALRPFGVVPNLSLVMVVLIGVESTVSMALAGAVVCGLVLDLSSSANFGLWTGLLVLAALAVGMLRRMGVEMSSNLAAIVVVAIGTIVSTVVILMGLVNVVSNWPPASLAGRFLAELGMNVGLVIVLRPLVRRLFRTKGVTLRAR